MSKTGIMGGTFNPVHNGHLMLAREALRQFKLDEVLFMPCGVPYMKAGREIESAQNRAEMTALAIRDMPGFALSTVEIDQRGNTYTYATLEYLKKRNPGTEYYFIVGADNLFHMADWVYPERFFANCCVLAAVRGGKTTSDMAAQAESLRKQYDADIRILRTECMDISSSAIRQKIKEGRSIERDVPEAVRNYIERKGLYQ